MQFGTRTFSFLTAALILAAALPFSAVAQHVPPQAPSTKPEILPLDQVKPGMKGVAYTIFEGDQPEPMEVEVIGVMPNLFGPKQHIILVELKGAKAEHTGVAFGMSGSPVYLEGKLAGALSLLIGIFAKKPIAGVTPIESVFEVVETPAVQRAGDGSAGLEAPVAAANHYPLPEEWAQRVGLGAGAYLATIDTPLAFSGFHPAAMQPFEKELRAYGLVATPGGTAEPRADDAQVKPGHMVSMVVVQGDLSLQASCTVTAVVEERVYVCGHPVFGFGQVEMPMARARVVTTLASSLASFKLVNAGSVIGTFTQDRRTALLGRLGPAPRLIPVEMAFSTPTQEKRFRFEVIEHPKLTPLFVAIAVFNGLVANPAYGEGTTFQMTGSIELRGHSPVSLENMFAPTDLALPDGLFVALTAQSVFGRIYNNPYERAVVDKVSLRITSLPERRWAAIEGAWSEKSEVRAGEQVGVKVMLRPYRGAPVIREVPITIPPQAAKGPLRIVVSDADSLNRLSRIFLFNPQSRLPGLEPLIRLLNRERRNNRLYITLLQPTPTLLLEEKELPNAPLSQINVLDQRRAPGSTLLLRESTAGEWSVPMNQVISGQYVLTILVK